MVTVILIAITCLVSILCFTGTLNANKLLLHAYSVWHRKEWYRMLTYGVVHGGWGHLLFNMLTLFFFGRVFPAGLPPRYLPALSKSTGTMSSLVIRDARPADHRNVFGTDFLRMIYTV